MNKSYIQKMLHDFDTTLTNMEALNSYFDETISWIKSKKIKNESKYRLAIALKAKLDSIYDQPVEKRKDFIQELNDQQIDGVKFSDIISVSLNDKCDVVEYEFMESYKREENDPVGYRQVLSSINNQEKIFIRSILSNIVIIFEQYFSNIYETLLYNDPQNYFENKTIRLADIFDENFKEIIGHQMKKEVDDNMYDSLKTLSRIKDKSQIDVDRYIPIRKEFEEVYYRRNLCVHAEGIVNGIYLEKVDAKYTRDIKEGQELVCDEMYLNNAIITLHKIVASLHFEMLKFFGACQDQYDSLADMGFDALKKGTYVLAEYIYGILRREKTFEYKIKAIYEVNYINALKLQGKNVENLIKAFDVSIATDDYKIAKECLLDNHEVVYDMLTQTYPESFSANLIREWPIFIRFRESEYYQKFIDEHKTDFDKFVFENEAAPASVAEC